MGVPVGNLLTSVSRNAPIHSSDSTRNGDGDTSCPVSPAVGDVLVNPSTITRPPRLFRAGGNVESEPAYVAEFESRLKTTLLPVDTTVVDPFIRTGVSIFATIVDPERTVAGGLPGSQQNGAHRTLSI